MTGTPQFIKPYPDIRAGNSMRTFLLARHGTTFTINGFNFRGVSRRNPLEFSRTTDRGVPSAVTWMLKGRAINRNRRAATSIAVIGSSLLSSAIRFHRRGMAMNGRTVGVLMFAGLVASAGTSLQSLESPATCEPTGTSAPTIVTY